MNLFKIIGIIGGGQLGQMMVIVVIYMGYKVIMLDLVSDCFVFCVSEVIVVFYDDVEVLGILVVCCDVLIYEFENVDVDGLDVVVLVGQLLQGIDLFCIF